MSIHSSLKHVLQLLEYGAVMLGRHVILMTTARVDQSLFGVVCRDGS